MGSPALESAVSVPETLAEKSSRLLDRQLRKRALSPDRLPSDEGVWADLLETIARTYTEAEQGRELMERSLAISSSEMQGLYTRHRAISACAQALLLNDDEEDAVTAALEAILGSTGASCAWIDENVESDNRGSIQRRWSLCNCENGEPPHPAGPLGSWYQLNAESLSHGETLRRLPPGRSGEPGQIQAFVPILGHRGWIATLVTTGPPSRTLVSGEAEVLGVAAQMFGAFMDRRDSHWRLQQRELELEALVRSKDHLIATISHEIRTPMTAIMGYAQLLQDNLATISSADGHAYVAALVQQGAELSSIVDDLIVVARADMGELNVVSVRVDLLAQAHQVLETIGTQIEETITLNGTRVWSVGDPGRVRQIIRNLIVNASRYGGLTIEVKLHADEHGSHLLVIDDGPGVPKDRRDRIFEAYERGSETPGLTHSLGLGLYLCRMLARRMGGDVTYRRVDEKTVFDLTLPVATDQVI